MSQPALYRAVALNDLGELGWISENHFDETAFSMLEIVDFFISLMPETCTHKRRLTKLTVSRIPAIVEEQK